LEPSRLEVHHVLIQSIACAKLVRM
jgi:hypothetical protein